MTQTFFEIGDTHGNEITLIARTPEVVELATRIYDECDDSGVIQAAAMLRCFPGRPTLHTTTRLYTALLEAGCEIA